MDLRLAPPAVAAWVVAWQGRLLDPAVLCGVSLGAVAVGALVLVASTSNRAAVVAGVLACAAASGLATAARVHSRESSPLTAAARQNASAVVEGTLLDDPHVLPPKTGVLAFREQVAARVRVEGLDVAGRRYRLREPVLVLSSDAAILRLLPSQRLRVEGRLSSPHRGSDVAALLSARGPPSALSGPSAVQQAAGVLRRGLRDAASVLPSDERGLLPGLVDGDTSNLDPSLQAAFRTTGLTHITAVSGTNVAVVLAVTLVLCGWLRIGLRWRAPVAGVVLVGFVTLARPSPSVLRAAAMGVIALVALASGARRQAMPALCAAVLGLVLISPDIAPQPGFALSTLATAGLLVIAPVWRTRWSGTLPGWLAEALAVPAAAQVACAPVIAGISGQLGVWAVPANLLAVPAVAPATVLGVVAALVAPLSLPVAHVVAWLAWLPAWWLVKVARTGAGLPGAGLSVGTGWTGAFVVFALMALGVVVLRSRSLRRGAASVAVGALVAALVLVAVRPPWPPPGWVLASCDVGQGDGFVVRLGAGSALVIDSGPDPAKIDDCLGLLSVRTIPLLILTHLHADHVEGVPGVLRGRRVAAVEIGPLDEPAIERQRLLGWLGARGIPVVRAQIGEVRNAGDVRWEVLDATARHGTDSDPNNSSIVLRLVTHGVRILFAGDLESGAQQQLLERRTDLRADILKVPHHGSAKQDPAFLDAVHAKIALTPVGAGNPYGHPSAQTLHRLEQDGARTYRSDRDGDVAVVVRGGHISTEGRGGNGVPPLGADSHQPSSVWSTSVASGMPTGLLRCDAGDPSGASVAARSRSPPWNHGHVLSPVPTLTLVVGDEEFLAARAVGAVVSAVRKTAPEAEVREFDGASLEPGDLVEAFSPSLFGDDRVVVIREAQDVSKDVAGELEAYAGDPAPEIALVVVHAGGAKGKAIVTALVGKGAQRVDVPKLTKLGERRDFVRAELRADGRQVADDAVTTLLDAIGSDLRELASAASQLLADTDGAITEDAVRRYYSGRADATGFSIADRAVDGDLAGALELCRWGQSTGLAPVLVTSAVASSLRSIGVVASAGRRPAHQLAGELGMPPWKVEKTQRQARGWSPEALTAAMLAVATADADVKGEGADKDYAVESMLVAVCSARGSARGGDR